MLNTAGLSLWSAIIYRVITLLVLMACGLHSHVQYKRRGKLLIASERGMYLAFSLIFLFGIAANFGAIVLAAKMKNAGGPFSIGEFSLLSAILYLIVNFWVSQKRRI